MKNGKYCSSKKAMKPLAVLLAMILLVGCAVGGTLAWLTAETTEVKNTFTSAKLFADPEKGFTLWEHEAVLETDGQYTLNSTNKVQANTYKILPGVNIPKDPTVDIENLQENAYLYIKVASTLPAGLTYSIDTTNWKKLGDDYPGVYVYSGTHAETNKVIKATKMDPKTFIATILTNDQIVVAADYSGNADVTLSFNAYMVQATGNGDDATEAWANTYGATTNP